MFKTGDIVICVNNQNISWSNLNENLWAKSLILHEKYRINDSFIHIETPFVIIDGRLFLAERFETPIYIRLLKLKELIDV
jgi:hypothetical protein